MHIAAEHRLYWFGSFVLDLGRGALLAADGRDVPLRAKSFALLRFLVEQAGNLVTREAIMEELWPNIFVLDDNITQCIVEIRRGLGSEAREILRTVPRRGYLLAAPVTVESLRADRAGERATPGGRGLMPQPAAAGIKGTLTLSRPSIAVLAFANLSNDRHQEYLSDGVADDLITELARNRLLFVVARTSSFSYKGRRLDIKQIAGELGVQYIVDGSVRRYCDRMRITARLIDLDTGGHIWADRFDHGLDDLFSDQDWIIRAMVAAIDAAIREAEQRRAMHGILDAASGWGVWQQAH